MELGSLFELVVCVHFFERKLVDFSPPQFPFSLLIFGCVTIILKMYTISRDSCLFFVSLCVPVIYDEFDWFEND